MRILLATHGFPPEQVGGVELHTRELAFELARLGQQIFVVAGTLERSARPGELTLRRESIQDPAGQRIEVARIARHDLYFDHWHKSLSADVARAFRELLLEFRPDIVHVQHWIRLSRDLVTVAARAGIPSVVTLHDSWASCPIVFRVRPDTLRACDAIVGPHPCIACAERVPPRTPWVPTDSAYMLLALRQRDIAREIDLARARIAPSRAHARALERWLGRASDSLDVEIIAPCAQPLAPRSARDGAGLKSSLRNLGLTTWSQIARHKGLDVLIEAFKLASARLTGERSLSLHVLGAVADPGHFAELREATAGTRVSWGKAHEQPENSLAQIFVSSSRAHESYGVSVDEAAGLGLALLLPDAPAFLERFQDVALFYASGSASSLADEIVRLAHEPARLESARRAAVQYASRLSSNGSHAQRHLTLYERAVAAGAPATAPENWFDARMSMQATLEWDRALSQRTALELGQ